MKGESDPLLSELLSASRPGEDRELADKYSPVLRFDRLEPFFPLAVGYTVFRKPAESPSFRQGKKINFLDGKYLPAEFAVEYAIWWDWDIGHLYELEHVWVYVGYDGEIVYVEASWHGDCRAISHQGQVELLEGHPVLLSEPGKHAFAPSLEWFQERKKQFKRSETKDLAGISGVLRSKYLSGKVKFTPLNQRLAHTYLSRFCFEPAWDFSQVVRFTKEDLVPWQNLLEWIPRRVNAWIDRLNHEISPEQYRFLRIGHRGASAYRPDNSLAGFRHAAALGADMVELDVQQTREGQAAVIHDLYLRAPGGWILPVKESSMDELRKVDLGGGERVPTLKEALEVCQEENLGAYIEIKDGAAVPLIVQTLRELDYGGYSILGSFRPDWLLEARRANPHLATSILFGSTGYDGAKSVHLARSCQANFVHPCWESHPRPYELLSPDWVREVRKAGLGILLWHEERPEIIAELRKAGVDGICSDKPDLLL